MTTIATRARERASDSTPRTQGNLFLVPERQEDRTKALQDLLAILEQRAKEILMHVKTGQICEHIDDKQAAIERSAALTDDLLQVAKSIASIAAKSIEDVG